MARRGDRYENGGAVVDQWPDEHEAYGQMASTFDVFNKCFSDHGNELLAQEMGEIQPY